jgi:hypothetical protein
VAPPVPVNVKEVALIVDPSIGSLKVAASICPIGTFLARFAGTTETTDGGGVIVVNVHT